LLGSHYFYSLAVGKRTAINIGVQVSLFYIDLDFFDYMQYHNVSPFLVF
jgi:hypothetical protein